MDRLSGITDIIEGATAGTNIGMQTLWVIYAIETIISKISTRGIIIAVAQFPLIFNKLQLYMHNLVVYAVFVHKVQCGKFW